MQRLLHLSNGILAMEPQLQTLVAEHVHSRTGILENGTLKSTLVLVQTV
jgi:hypothetical protein